MEHDSSIFGLKPAFQSQKTYCCVSSVLFMSATSRDNETVCVPSPFDNPAPASSRPRSNSSGNVSYGTSFAPFHQSDDPFGPPAFSSASASSSQPPPSFGEGPGTRGRTHSSAGVGYGGTVYGQPQGGYPGGYDPYAGGSCYGGGAGDFGGGVGGGGYGYGGAPQPFGAHSYAPSAPEMKMDDDFPVYFADEPEQFPGGPSSAPLPLGAAGRGRSESSVGVAPLDIRTCPVCKSLSDDLLMTFVASLFSFSFFFFSHDPSIFLFFSHPSFSSLLALSFVVHNATQNIAVFALPVFQMVSPAGKSLVEKRQKQCGNKRIKSLLNTMLLR